MSTPCSLRNCSSSIFLLRTPSAFQLASRKALYGVLLGPTVMLHHETNDGFEDGSRASVPFGRDEAVESRRSVSFKEAEV
jgi:hypothetical protein